MRLHLGVSHFVWAVEMKKIITLCVLLILSASQVAVNAADISNQSSSLGLDGDSSVELTGEYDLGHSLKSRYQLSDSKYDFLNESNENSENDDESGAESDTDTTENSDSSSNSSDGDDSSNESNENSSSDNNTSDDNSSDNESSDEDSSNDSSSDASQNTQSFSATVLSNIQTYVNTNHSGQTIIKMEQETNYIEVDLSNGIEIYFDNNGNFMRYDN